MDGARRANALALSIAIVVLAAGCTSPTQRSPDGAGITSPLPARPSAGSGPRFAADGPNADEYGARESYPVKAIYRVPFFVGLFSHYDEILRTTRSVSAWRQTFAILSAPWAEPRTLFSAAPIGNAGRQSAIGRSNAPRASRKMKSVAAS